MPVNLGNVVGLLKSTTAPTKKYVVWAKILNPSFPDIVELHYWDDIAGAWTPLTETTTNYWLRPVLSATTTTPPVTPTEGDRYVIPAGATGVWSSQVDKVATFKSGAWQYQTPLDGYIVVIRDQTSVLFDYRGVFGMGGTWVVDDFYLPIAPGTYIPSTDKGIPLGVATLDSSGKLPVTQVDGSTLPFTPGSPGDWPGTSTVWNALDYLRTLSASSDTDDWKRGGNTVGVVTSIGTIDNYDFFIKRNNVEVARFVTGEHMGIGLTSGIDARVHVKQALNGKGLKVQNSSDVITVEVGQSAGSDYINFSADTITIGKTGATINIVGTTNYQNVTQLQVTDPLITLNKGGGVASAVNSGIEIEENSSITGYIKTVAGRDGYRLKAPAIASDATISLASITGARTYTLPNTSGTFRLTSDPSVDAWLIASGATLTGVNNVTSNVQNQLIFNGTWVATTNSAYHVNFTSAQTGRAGQAADVLYGYKFSSGLTTGTNGQTLVGVYISSTFAGTGSFIDLMTEGTSTGSGTAIINRVKNNNTAGFGLFQASSDDGYISQFGITGSTYTSGLYLARQAQFYTDGPGGVLFAASGGGKITFTVGGTGTGNDILNLDTSSATGYGYFQYGVLVGSRSTFSDTVNKLQVNGAFGIFQNGVDATSTATQKPSYEQHFRTSLWNGSVATKGWMSWRDDASTATNQLHNLTLYASIGASPTFGSALFKVYSTGSIVVGNDITFAMGVPGAASSPGIQVSGADWYFRNYLGNGSTTGHILLGSGGSGILSEFFANGDVSIASQTDTARLYVNQAAQTSAWKPAFKVDPGAHTALTAAQKAYDLTGAAWSWASGSGLTVKFTEFGSFTTNTSGSATITDAFTAYFNTPTAGTITPTNLYAVGVNGPLGLLISGGPSTGGLNFGLGGGSNQTGIHSNDGASIRFVVSGTSVARFLNTTSFEILPAAMNVLVGSSTANAKLYVFQSALSSAWIPGFRVDPGAHTSLSSTTEFIANDFRGANWTWAAGTIATQRFNYWRQFTVTTGLATYAYTGYFDAPTGNITNSIALGVNGSLSILGTADANSIRITGGPSPHAISFRNSAVGEFAALNAHSSSGEIYFTANSGYFYTWQIAGANKMQMTTGGNLNVGTSSSNIAKLYVLQQVLTSAWIPAFRTDPGAHTSMTASTEFVANDFSGANWTWASSGGWTNQRYTWFRSPTTNTGVPTNVYTVYVDAPTGTGTNKYALGVSGNVNVIGGELWLAATTTGYASLRMPAGTAPSSPVHGQFWTTPTDAFARINGSTGQIALWGVTQGIFANSTFNLAGHDIGFYALTNAGESFTINIQGSGEGNGGIYLEVGGAGDGINLTGSDTTETVKFGLAYGGMIYGADYSANFTARSLVDKGYVTTNAWSLLSGGALTGPNLITGNTSNTFSLRYDNRGTTITEGAGVHIYNLQPAANGAQQNSPYFSMLGQGWRTGSGGATETVAVVTYVKPVQGTLHPTYEYHIAQNVNSAGYSDILNLGFGNAVLTFGTNTVTIGGDVLIFSAGASATNITNVSGLNVNSPVMKVFTPDNAGTSGTLYLYTGDGNGVNSTSGDIFMYVGAKTGSGKHGNIGLFSTNTDFDAAEKVLRMASNVTDPSGTIVADHAYMWVKDITAGNAAIHMMTEAGDLLKLYAVAGWGTPTNTLTRTTFDTSTITHQQLAERVGALISDLKTLHGFLKA